jgi:hypothetical protein
MSSATEEAFRLFHAANPEVYDRLVSLARGLVRKGNRRVGIKMLFEVLRWHHMATAGDADGFKLNNNYHSYYARLIMHREPDLAGVFELRRLNADEPFGQHASPQPAGHVAPPGFLFPDPEGLFD